LKKTIGYKGRNHEKHIIETMIEVKEVRSLLDLLRFVSCEYEIKKGEKAFVPPIFLERLITLKYSSFFKHGKAKLFIAKDGKKVVGRISAQIDELYIKKWNEKSGFFGFFECINSNEVAERLLTTAENYLKNEGMKKIMGSFSFNINGESGILVQGFDEPPFVMMPFNPPYYADLLEKNGYSKAKDLFAWKITRDDVEKKTSSLLKLVWKGSEGKVRIREVTKKTLDEDIKITVEIFNDAWSDNWGFTPLTQEEGKEIAQALKIVLDSKIAILCYIGDKPAGVCIAIPNINEILAGTNGGKTPFDLIRIITRLKTKKIKSFRLIILGVRREFRKDYPFLPLFMVGEIIKRGKERGYESAELSWTLEDNERINKIITITGAQKYKIYRIYKKELK
jgi:hypothetical protein